MTARGDARREQIFTVGARLFAQKGYERTSLKEVADLLGLTKPALYYYYASKEELLFEILSFVMERLLNDIREIAGGDGLPADRLAAFIRRYIGFFVAHPNEHALLSVQVDALCPALRDRILENQREYLRHVRVIVGGLLTRGSAAEIDETSATFALLGGMNWIFKWYHPEGRISPEKLAADFLALYADGFTPRCELRPACVTKPTTSNRRKERK